MGGPSEEDQRQSRPLRPSSWRRGVTAVLLVVSVVAIVWILVERRQNLAELANIRPVPLVLLFLASALHLLTQSGRFHAILIRIAGHGRGISFKGWTHIFVIGRFLNFIIPQGGSVYRGMEVKRQFGVSYTAYAAMLLSSAWLATTFNLILACLLLAALDPALHVAGAPALPVLLLGAGLSLAGPFAIRWLIPASVPIERLRWLRKRVERLFDITVESVQDSYYLIRMLLWGLAAFVVAVWLFMLAFLALTVDVGLPEVVVFYTLRQMMSYVSFTPGNVGVQEALFGLLGSVTAIGAAEGVLVSALLRAMAVLSTTAIAVPLGGMAALRHARSAAVEKP